MAGSSGFNGMYQVDADGYKPGMFVIWRPKFVALKKLSYDTKCINVIIQVYW